MGGKSCFSPRWEPAKGRPGAGRGRRGPGYVPGLGQRGRSCANTDAAAAPGGAEPAGCVHRLPRSPPPCAQVSPRGAGTAWQDPPLAPDTTGRLMVVGPSWPPPLRDNVPCYAPGIATVPSVQGPQPTPTGCPGCCSLALGAFPEMRGAGVCWVGHAGHWWLSVSDIPGSAGQSTPSSQGCRAGDSGGASLGRLRPGQC